MVSRDGILLGVIWMIFTILFAFVTVAWLKPSPSLDTLRSLMDPKLIFFSIIIAIAALEYRLPRVEAKEQRSSLSYTFGLLSALSSQS